MTAILAAPGTARSTADVHRHVVAPLDHLRCAAVIRHGFQLLHGLSVCGFARGDPVRATDRAAHRVAYHEAWSGAGHHESGEQADASLPRSHFAAEPRLVGGEGAGVIAVVGGEFFREGYTLLPSPCWTRRPAGLWPPPRPRAVRPVRGTTRASGRSSGGRRTGLGGRGTPPRVPAPATARRRTCRPRFACGERCFCGRGAPAVRPGR